MSGSSHFFESHQNAIIENSVWNKQNLVSNRDLKQRKSGVILINVEIISQIKRNNWATHVIWPKTRADRNKWIHRVDFLIFHYCRHVESEITFVSNKSALWHAPKGHNLWFNCVLDTWFACPDLMFERFVVALKLFMSIIY